MRKAEKLRYLPKDRKWTCGKWGLAVRSPWCQVRALSNSLSASWKEACPSLTPPGVLGPANSPESRKSFWVAVSRSANLWYSLFHISTSVTTPTRSNKQQSRDPDSVILVCLQRSQGWVSGFDFLRRIQCYFLLKGRTKIELLFSACMGFNMLNCNSAGRSKIKSRIISFLTSLGLVGRKAESVEGWWVATPLFPPAPCSPTSAFHGWKPDGSLKARESVESTS